MDELDDDKSHGGAFSDTRQAKHLSNPHQLLFASRRRKESSPGHVDVYVRLSDDAAGAAVSGPVLLVDWDVELVGEGIHVVC